MKPEDKGDDLKQGRAVVSRGRKRKEGKEPDRLATLDTALELLKIIAANNGKMSLTQLSIQSDQQPNKLHRYLASFKHHGFLTQSAATGLYDIGPESLALGMSALRRYDPMSGVHALLSEIAELTGFATYLYVWTPSGPTMIKGEAGIQSLPVILRLGSVLPLCESATGLVFLALMPKDVTATQLSKEINQAQKENRAIDLDYVDTQVAKIKETDIYWSNRAVISGTVAVMPLADRDGRLACAITCVLPKGQATPKITKRVEQILRSSRDNASPTLNSVTS